MELINKTTKLFYLACLILVLSQLRGHISKTQVRSYLRGSKHLLGRISARLSQSWSEKQPSPDYSSNISTNIPSIYRTQPLVMDGGDPYIRALMRTITASEANVARPYNVLYGGRYVEDLGDHPQICVPIVAGPNIGNCTTAAGRYQMLDYTWEKQAKRYHPNPSGIWRWKSYNFAAEYQDVVVHNWLSDRQVWGTDIPQLLRQGEIAQVLKLLSGTWTSLGYGIETNSMSKYLQPIYQNVLREELS